MISDKLYRRRYRQLKRYHDFTFKLPRKSLSPNQKRSISIQWKLRGERASLERASNRTGTGFRFLKASKRQRQKLKKIFKNGAVTNKGVFLKVPSNSSGNLESVTLNSKGEVILKIGKRTQIYINFSEFELLKKPQKILTEIFLGRPEPDAINFTINGDKISNFAMDLPEFAEKLQDRYITNIINKFKSGQKSHHKDRARITGLVLTYFGPISKHKKVTKKRISDVLSA